MKQIQPVVFPLNLGTATILYCVGSDNFSTNVTIFYQLLTQYDQIVQASSIIMSGNDYELYNTSNDGNEYIYQWTANQIGVILL
jgi:hypothetical protein